VDFYDQVLRELVVALGAALFVGNGLAMLRRRRDRRAHARPVGARSTKVKGASRRRATGRRGSGDLVAAPLGRSAVFAALGFVMMLAGIAALTR
jgi:hypothetical protein